MIKGRKGLCFDIGKFVHRWDMRTSVETQSAVLNPCSIRCRAEEKSDRYLIHSHGTACCTDLDALFNSARMSGRKAQNSAAPLVYHSLFESFVSPFQLRHRLTNWEIDP